jgi:hypothetical protein
VVKAFRTMGILCDVFKVSIQVTDSVTCRLTTLIDGYTAEYRAHRHCHFPGMLNFLRNTTEADVKCPQRLKSGEMCRLIGFDSAVLTQTQVLSKDFATK